MYWRNGVPCTQISVIDTFLRIQTAVHDIVRKVAEDFSVFHVQLMYRLLVAIEKHLDNFFIFDHCTTSFPPSPIYYDFSGKY